MSELSTQESSDDLDPISESPSKTLDEDEHESSSENDETLEEDEEKENNEQTLDTANANLDFRSTDMENNIPVSIIFSGAGPSYERPSNVHVLPVDLLPGGPSNWYFARTFYRRTF